MKILTPFNHISQLELLVASGANEFYMGFSDRNWQEKYGDYRDINRLTAFKERANGYCLQEIEEIVRKIHSAGAKLYITLNAPGYARSQLQDLKNYIEILAGYGADGVITSVPELIPEINRSGMMSVASTMCGICNADLARSYADYGIQRIILPREASIPEISEIVKKVPDVEYEVFLMRNGCRYMDAGCLGIHGGECGGVCSSVKNGICNYISNIPGTYGTQWQWMSGKSMEQRVLEMHERFRQYHEFACGQCAVWYLEQLGIAAAKIVGRMDHAEEVAADVALTAHNLEIAADCRSQEEYFARMKMPGSAEEYCRQGLSCYYPEICWIY